MTVETGSIRDHCIRCGTCCLKSSPALHVQDISLIDSNTIPGNNLYTVRKDEFAWDPVKNRLINTPEEFLKINEKGSSCVFYEEQNNSCTIYRNRPSQCSALKCWDTEGFMEIFNSPKLERKDIVDDGVLLGLIEEHEKRCSYSLLKQLIEDINSKGETVLKQILDILRFDHQMRPFVSGKLGLDPTHMNLYFGRPLTETIIMFGLKVEHKSDGSFLLTTNQETSHDHTPNSSL